MLNSDRKFGVEIEFIAPTKRDFTRIATRLPVEYDGSLRPHPHAGEYVSPVLSGKSGEEAIHQACRTMKSASILIDNPKTSFHLHIDGMKGDKQVVELSKPSKTAKQQVGISGKALKHISKNAVASILINNYPILVDEPLQYTSIDGVQYLSLARLRKPPKTGYTYLAIEENDRFKWLRNVFYFYTQYDLVMQGVVSNSRKIKNMYCQSISDSFDLDEIEQCKSTDDIIDVWYKGRGIGGKYDDSRYHNVNLHSYFLRHGTVEIRSHGATIDPYKILLWVRLHQFIADKLEDMELDDIKIDTSNPDNIYLGFIEFIKEDEVLVEYVKRLLGYFSGVSITGNGVKYKKQLCVD